MCVNERINSRMQTVQMYFDSKKNKQKKVKGKAVRAVSVDFKRKKKKTLNGFKVGMDNFQMLFQFIDILLQGHTAKPASLSCKIQKPHLYHTTSQ